MAWLDAVVLLVAFGGLLAFGVPVAYAIGLGTMAAMLVSMPALPALVTVAQRMATGLDAFTLLAIPFFVLAGQLMSRGGGARRLIDLARVMVGPVPGALAHVNVVAAMLFGAVSGSAVAAASAIGGVMAPRMARDGYAPSFGAAINIASSTTGLIIPPSNILIVYALASGGVSVAALFLAGYVPGILMGGLLMAVAAVQARRSGYPVGVRPTIGIFVRHVIDAVPSLLLLVVVIGGIVGGVFTATEAAAVAVFYALVLGLAYRELRLGDVPGILRDSVSTSAVVLFLVATSMAMSWMLAYANVPQTVAETLLGLTDSRVLIFLIINVVLLVVGTVMDMTPAVLIFTPIFLPVVERLGMDPVQFGIVLVLNLCVGLCTPPVGSVLFVGCGVAEVRIADVVRPLLPLLLAMIVALLLVTYVPAISLALPGLVAGP